LKKIIGFTVSVIIFGLTACSSGELQEAEILLLTPEMYLEAHGRLPSEPLPELQEVEQVPTHTTYTIFGLTLEKPID